MAENIKRIFVFCTPFHLEAILSIYDQKIFGAKDTLVIKYDVVKELPFTPTQYIEVPSKLVSIRRTDFLKIRKIKGIGRFLEQNIVKYSLSDVKKMVLGTDKGVFCQLLVKLVKRRNPDAKVVLVDEGTGFYAQRTLIDTVYRKIYPIITFLLYGKRIEFVKPIGTSSFTDIIYVRFLDKLAYRSNSIEYREFRLKKNIIDLKVGKGKHLLLFTLPNDLKSIGDKEKKQFVEELIKLLKKKKISLWIKPHPRENIGYLPEFREGAISIIQAHIPGDKIPFDKFEAIINFKSSVVMSVLDSGYSPQKVITISPAELKFDKLFEGTHIIPFNERIYTRIEDLLNIS